LALTLLASGCKKEPTETTTLLHRAARAGNIERVRSLISSGADINAKVGLSGWTALHEAADNGHKNIVEFLIAKGADVNAKTKSGWSPLHYAARGGYVNVAELLVANGTDIDAKTKSGYTPLHEAGLRGYYNVVDLLLEKGADVNAKTEDGQTALECARAAGHEDVAELLTADHTNVEATERHDETSLDFAVGYGHEGLEEPRTDEERLVLDNSTFAFNLYQQLRSREGNLFLSPYSISTALAMTYAGARGNTEKQMAETLGFSLEQKNLHPAFAQLQAGLNKLQEDGNVKLCVANSLWPQLGQPFLDEYLSLVEKYYGVSITPVDYAHAREAARKTINEWVENKTNNRIKDLIKPHHLTELTRLVLTNAIYFKGNWENQFDPTATEEATFYISPKKSVQVPMMRQTEVVRYAEFRSLQILELPYVGNSLSMLVLLPRRIEGLKQLEDSLSVENLSFWRKRLEEKEVIIFLPKFKMTSSFDLKETLQAMGMVDAFTVLGANFAGFDGDPRWFFIGEVIHKAFVEVNEEGTEAAAATAVLMGLAGVGAQPPTFRADHPFLLLIQDRQTGSILFIGRVTDPTKSGQ
jgi:serpin B